MIVAALSRALFLTVLLIGYGEKLKAVAEDDAFTANSSDSINAVLLMDSSASMLVNDPEKLRDQGARLFLQFLKPGDSLAIVKFDEKAEVVRPLSPFSGDQLASVQSQLQGVQASGQFTDLNAGLLAAAEILRKDATKGAKPVIILLSDGRMDPAPTRGTADSHMDQLSNKILPEFKAAGFKVYTLAFSQDADKPLLQHIAQATDAVNWFTPNSDTIHESFADLFLSVKKPQVAASSAKGFKIESDIEEATFYINQAEGARIEIEDPNEERFSAGKPGEKIRWFDGKKFSVITINEPDAGEWKLIGVNPDDGFATILTNLKLVTDWPNSIALDTPQILRARLYEGKIPVDLEAMAQSVTFAFQVTPSDRVSEPIMREFLNDEGKDGDETAGDGIFSLRTRFKEAGEYKLRVLAKGPTFERQLQIPFRVRPPLVTFTIVERGAEHETAGHEGQSPEEHSHAGNEHDPHDHEAKHEGKSEKAHETHSTKSFYDGSENSIFNVELSEEATTFKGVEVSIRAVDSSRQKFTLVASAPSSGHGSHGGGSSLQYQVSAASLPKDGTYELTAYLTAKTRNGKEVTEESKKLKFKRTTINEDAIRPVEIIKEVKVEPDEKSEKAPEAGPLTGIVVVTLLNLLLAGAMFVLLKKKSPSSSVVMEYPPVSAELLSGVEDLERRAQLDAVSFDDPRLQQLETPAVPSTPAPEVAPASEEAAPG